MGTKSLKDTVTHQAITVKQEYKWVPTKPIADKPTTSAKTTTNNGQERVPKTGSIDANLAVKALELDEAIVLALIPLSFITFTNPVFDPNPSTSAKFNVFYF